MFSYTDRPTNNYNNVELCNLASFVISKLAFIPTKKIFEIRLKNSKLDFLAHTKKYPAKWNKLSTTTECQYWQSFRRRYFTWKYAVALNGESM